MTEELERQATATQAVVMECFSSLSDQVKEGFSDLKDALAQQVHPSPQETTCLAQPVYSR